MEAPTSAQLRPEGEAGIGDLGVSGRSSTVPATRVLTILRMIDPLR